MAYMRDKAGKRLDSLHVQSGLAPFDPSQIIRRMAGRALMATPPTITKGVGTVSVLTAPTFHKAAEVAGGNPILRAYGGPVSETPAASGQVVAVAPYGQGGVFTPQVGSQSVMRYFGFYGTQFEVVHGRNNALWRLWDFELVDRSLPTIVANGTADSSTQNDLIAWSGSPRWHWLGIEGEAVYRFMGLNLDAGGALAAYRGQSRGRLICVGDSLWQANHADLGENGVAFYQSGGLSVRLGRRLGLMDVWSMSLGGTGIVRDRSTGDPHYGARLATDVLPFLDGATAVLFSASINDLTPVDHSNDGTVQTEVASLIARCRAVDANCVIVFTGMQGSSLLSPAAGAVTPTLLANYNAQIQAACTAADVPFIDKIPRFLGTGNTGAPNGTGLNDVMAPPYNGTTIIPPHMNQLGHDTSGDVIAGRLSPYLFGAAL